MANKNKNNTLSVLQKQMSKIWKNSTIIKNRRDDVKIKNSRKSDR